MRWHDSARPFVVDWWYLARLAKSQKILLHVRDENLYLAIITDTNPQRAISNNKRATEEIRESRWQQDCQRRFVVLHTSHFTHDVEARASDARA